MSIKRSIICIFGGLLLIISIANWLFGKKTQITLSRSEEIVYDKICYLTFDDGPSFNTEKVLDILKKYNIKATFFLIGSEIGEEDRAILERMHKEGHAIGLHSNVHDFDKVYSGAEQCVNDYVAEYELLKNEYGIETKLFRFPGGSACKYMYGQRNTYVTHMQEKGFLCFDWHVSGEDSVGSPTVYSIQEHVMNSVFKYEHPIVLLHDSGIAGVTVDALPGIIESIQAKNYSFATLQDREEYIFP